MSIAANLENLRSKISADVTLVAVSKTKPVEDIREAYNAGQRDFGENKIQEMAGKYESLPKDIRWHMIGHVQGNKIKYMAPFVHLVHGIDKLKRLGELNKEAVKNNRTIDCLLQIHIADEETKFGFSYQEVEQLIAEGFEEKYPNLRIRGLMGMATNTPDETQIKKEFNELNSFFNKIKTELNIPHFDTLSMGMSGDYSYAIEAGSNMVRIGSSIFGQRNYH